MERSRQRMSGRSKQRGFSLIELLVVLVILGLLAGLIGPQIMGYLGTSRHKAAELQMQQFGAALDLYRLDVGRYPTTEQGLQALVERPAGIDRWAGPYLREPTVPSDPWGQPYAYKAPGRKSGFEILSLGGDGKPGGDGEDADIVRD